jgi:hypothetical protein
MTQLASRVESLYGAAAGICEQQPDAFLVGSIGRHAVMGRPLNPTRPDGSSRDIDVLRIGDRDTDISCADHEIDTIFENWITPDGSYLIFPHNPDIQVEVPNQEVYETTTRTVDGYDVRLPHPQLLHRISTMQFIQRPKDVVAMRTYEAFLAESGEAMHPELLRPFEIFRAILSRRNGYVMAGKMRNVYQQVVPKPVRQELQLGPRLGWLRAH